MKKHLFLAIIPLMVALFLAFGCETTTTPTDGGNGGNVIDSLLREAYQAMVDGDYTGAGSLYDQVLQLDSDNSEAMFGKATCMIFLLENDPEIDSLIQFFEEFGDSFYFPKMGHMPKLGSNFASGMCEGAYAWLSKPFQGPDYTIGELQAFIIDRVFPIMDTLINFFEVIETDPNFTFTIYPELCDCDDTIEVDLGDIYAIHSQLYLAHSILNFFVSYNMDLGEDDTCLIDILEIDTFMTLKDDGEALMGQAKTYLLSGIDFCSTAVYFIEHETDDQSDDFIILDQEDIDSAYSWLGMAKQALTQTMQDVPVPGPCDNDTRVFYIDIDLGEFFDNPIEDYKDCLPPYTILDGCNELEFDEPLVLPNPTFNGVFPNMTSGDWIGFFNCP